MRTAENGGKDSMDQLLDRIRESHYSMSPTHQAVAKSIIDNPRIISFLSAASVGKSIGASAATVVRFADSLGLSGYAELQRIARNALMDELSTVSQLQRAKKVSEGRSLLTQSLRADIANLENTATLISEAVFDRAVDILYSARTIHLLGLRSTFGLVHHFKFYLGWIGREANLVHPNVGEESEQIMNLEPNDACVAFSFKRYTSATIELFKELKKTGAPTIAVTDSNISPLAEIADLSLTVSVDFPAFFESRVSALSLINALFFAMALKDTERTLKFLRLHEKKWAEAKTYSSEIVYMDLKRKIAEFEKISRKGKRSVTA
jgi:DNA-binding MurR/RpiR family transcriptional regulator